MVVYSTLSVYTNFLTPSAALVLLALILFLPSGVSNSFARDVYNVGVSVLSIIFSVFIAALSIIMASGSDDFVSFMEEEGRFSLLLWMFKVTLLLLFIALIYSLSLYSATSFWIIQGKVNQNKTFISAFSFLCLWALSGTLVATLTALKYSQMRIKFFKVMKGLKARQENDR